MIEPLNLEKAILKEAAVRIQDLLRACLPDNYIFGNLYGNSPLISDSRIMLVSFTIGTDLRCRKWGITVKPDQILITENHGKPTKFDLADPDCFDKVVDFVLEGEDLV